MTFAEILREMRLELRLSQPACAAHLGVSRRTLQYWEAGEARHIPHVLMQEGALARLTTLLTSSLNSAESAPVNLGSDRAGRDRGEPTEAAST